MARRVQRCIRIRVSGQFKNPYTQIFAKHIDDSYDHCCGSHFAEHRISYFWQLWVRNLNFEIWLSILSNSESIFSELQVGQLRESRCWANICFNGSKYDFGNIFVYIFIPFCQGKAIIKMNQCQNEYSRRKILAFKDIFNWWKSENLYFNPGSGKCFSRLVVFWIRASTACCSVRDQLAGLPQYRPTVWDYGILLRLRLFKPTISVEMKNGWSEDSINFAITLDYFARR